MTRSWRLGRLWGLLWGLLWLGAMAPHALAQREFAEVPKPGADHSAYRLDSEVFGWTDDFSEVAGLGSEIVRGPGGKHRGELFLLVYRVGEVSPIHNVHVLFVTQSDQPHDPMPIADVRSKMWALGDSFIGMWKNRPEHQRPRGGMFIDLVYDPVEVQPGLCQPWVGFMLTYRGTIRYQPHQGLPLQVDCAWLKHTDTRMYWAKADLGAAMVQFDYSPDKRHEKSTRLIVSASWGLGETARLLLRTAWPQRHDRTRALLETLHRFGKTRVEIDPSLKSAAPLVAHSDRMRFMARRLREDLSATTTDLALPEDVDILVIDGREPPPAAPDAETAPATTESSSSSSSSTAGDKQPTAKQPPPAESSGSYINDWTLE